MFRFFYDLILTIISPFILVRLYIRGFRAPSYRKRVTERFGFFRFPSNFQHHKPTIWIHAVSVGEVLATESLINQLEQLYPDCQIFVTTMTPTGSNQVQRLFSGRVFHSYLPYDFTFALTFFIRRMNPKLLIIMETELWPNLINVTSSLGVKLILANARLSEKSATGYATFRSVTRRMLAKIDFIGAQSESDARRLVELGAKEKSIAVTGSLKYHINTRTEYEEDVSLFNELKISERSIVVAASTRAGEEEKLLVAIKSVLDELPTVLFIVVPRHPERFGTVYSKYEKSGLNCQLRSSNRKLTDDVQVLIGDSLGEMHSYYAVSKLAFVGGSLVDTGCHNILEPAALSLPVLVGPSQYNFAEICGQLEKAGGLLTVRDENELAEKVIDLLKDNPRRARMGSASKKEILANQNALPRLIEIIRGEMSSPD